MNEIVSNLLVYGSLPEDSILWQLADICEKLKDRNRDEGGAQRPRFPPGEESSDGCHRLRF